MSEYYRGRAEAYIDILTGIRASLSYDELADHCVEEIKNSLANMQEKAIAAPVKRQM